MAKNCQTHTRSEASENLSGKLPIHTIILPAAFRWSTSVLALLFLSFLGARPCLAQPRDVLCREGVGEFEAEFRTGVKVRVGAGRNKELAARVCDASLIWGNQTLVLAGAAWAVDLDAFGVDLGLGAPVVALQVKRTKAECCMSYEIYSLKEPPVLLHRITGGEFYSAADTDLDGRVEIWTDDSAAVEGFENLHLSDLDIPPPIVLRFLRDRLWDVSSEFRPYFDQKIAEARTKLDPRDLADFKTSDGQLSPATLLPAVRLSHLRNAKIKILEIVWAYLYSGREQEAWRSLAEMWPAADVDRIRAAILNARARGIRSQVNAVSNAVRPDRDIQAKIFDGTTILTATPGLAPKGAKLETPITPPRAILMEREPPLTASEQELAKLESTLKLVIDSAGKVRSVEEVGNVQQVDEQLLRSTANWKFIPAFNAGEPVASRILLGVSLRR
jgi:hypothetical protein